MAGPRIVEPPLPEPRYSFGGDEFVYCELSEAMSFHANFKGLAICQELERRRLDGVIEICPSNASYQVRIDPDLVDPREMLALLQELYDSVNAEGSFRTRVIDVPAFYNDPWTNEVLMRFRDRHQNPTGTDLEYVAEVNGFATEEEFIAAHHGAPYYVSMVGFVPGLPWCFQMVPRERMLEVPKYIRPRTDTPALALAHGGAFAAIYPVRGPGGYQLFAMCALPIFDPKQELPDFQDSFVVFRTGDIIKFRPIDREEYEAIRAEVEAKTCRYRMAEVDFDPATFFSDPDGYNARLLGELYG
jgi:urea carboxylase